MDKKTPNLDLFLLKEFQMQKELTINHALIVIDAMMKKQFESITITKPPKQIDEGNMYYVPDNAENEWFKHRNKIALFCYGWKYIPISPGFACWVRDQDAYMLYTNSGWATIFSEKVSTIDKKY